MCTIRESPGPCGADENGAGSWNDCISSIRLLPGWSARLLRRQELRGAVLEWTADVAICRRCARLLRQLRRLYLVDQGDQKSVMALKRSASSAWPHGKAHGGNLLKAGYPVVAHSRSKGPVDELVSAGAERASSPADVARRATRIITMLPDSPDVELVLEGEGGVFSAIQRGTIIIDNSSIAPAAARRLAARAKTFGATMLDAR